MHTHYYMEESVASYPEDTPAVIQDSVLKFINSVSSSKELTCLITPLSRVTNHIHFYRRG